MQFGKSFRVVDQLVDSGFITRLSYDKGTKCTFKMENGSLSLRSGERRACTTIGKTPYYYRADLC